MDFEYEYMTLLPEVTTWKHEYMTLLPEVTTWTHEKNSGSYFERDRLLNKKIIGLAKQSAAK